MKSNTKCKILVYDFENTSLNQIESDIEILCRDSFFSNRCVKTISTTGSKDKEENYIVTIIYETHFKWLKFLFFVILIYGIISLILFNY